VPSLRITYFLRFDWGVFLKLQRTCLVEVAVEVDGVEVRSEIFLQNTLGNRKRPVLVWVTAYYGFFRDDCSKQVASTFIAILKGKYGQHRYYGNILIQNLSPGVRVSCRSDRFLPNPIRDV